MIQIWIFTTKAYFWVKIREQITEIHPSQKSMFAFIFYIGLGYLKPT